MDVGSLKLDTFEHVTGRPSVSTSAAFAGAAAATRGRPRRSRAAGPRAGGGTVNILDQVQDSAGGALPHAAAAASPEAAAGSPRGGSSEEELAESLSKIRNYLELMDQHSLHHFLVWKGRTLDTTPEFQSFQRKYTLHWPAIQAAIRDIEQLLGRHAVPLAIVDGARLAQVATASAGRVFAEELVACIDNQDQVRPLLALPGKGRPQGTKRAQYIQAATRIQAQARMRMHRRRYRATIRRQRAARCLQCAARRRLAYRRVGPLLDQHRTSNAMRWEALQQRLRRQWTAGAVGVGGEGLGGEGSVGQDGGSSSRAEAIPGGAWPGMASCLPANRVEVHLPSLSIDEAHRLAMPQFPWEQNASLGRLALLRDPSLAHLVYVSPVEVPEEIMDYWVKLLALAGVDDAGQKRGQREESAWERPPPPPGR